MRHDSSNNAAAAETRQALIRKLRHNAEYREQLATSSLIENVSAQVRALRRQRGLTQKQLAERMGSKQPRVSNVELPPDSDQTNWEVDTLNRIALALGGRLKISIETFGSLADEFGSVTSDSLRRPTVENDPVLNPTPAVPPPDPDATERTRWMQERVIPWLWRDKLDLDSLVNWLQGYGLPPVGHDEDPSQWLLRGIPQQATGPVRKYMSRQLAERLAILLGEEPDLHPMVAERPDQFLISLYSTCAGLAEPGFLAEPLWATFKRLGRSNLNREVRDALQAALIPNQDGDKALLEIWKPMVQRGKHRRLSGGEIIGYQGIAALRLNGVPDYPNILWALQSISHRWSGTVDDQLAFMRMFESFPKRVELLRRLQDARESLSLWAQRLFPTVERQDSPEGTSITITAKPTLSETVVCKMSWRHGEATSISISSPAGDVRNELLAGVAGEVSTAARYVDVATYLGNRADKLGRNTPSAEKDIKLELTAMVRQELRP